MSLCGGQAHHALLLLPASAPQVVRIDKFSKPPVIPSLDCNYHGELPGLIISAL